MPNKYIDADALIAGIKQAKQTEFELAIKARRHKNMVAVGIRESHVGFCNQILDAIKAAEPEDVRPVVRGEFIGDFDGYADGAPVYDIWSCSVCGCVFEDFDEKPAYNFCPNCGADMREANNDKR